MVDFDFIEGLCGEKFVVEFCNFYEVCMKNFKDYVEEVFKIYFF